MPFHNRLFDHCTGTIVLTQNESGQTKSGDRSESYPPANGAKNQRRGAPSLKRTRTDTDTPGRSSKRSDNNPVVTYRPAPTISSHHPIRYVVSGSTLYRPGLSFKANAVEAVKKCEDIRLDNDGCETVLGSEDGIKMFRENGTMEAKMNEMMGMIMELKESQKTAEEERKREREQFELWKEHVDLQNDINLNHRRVAATAFRHISGHLNTRDRFIATFKRNQYYFDSLPRCSSRDKQLIDAANAEVHGGNAILDAELYVGSPQPRRNDKEVYRALYGFTPEQVLDIIAPYEEFIEILNIHAGNVGDPTYIKCDDEYHERWDEFLRTFWRNRADPETFLSHAYRKTPVGRSFLAYESARRRCVRRIYPRPRNTLFPPPEPYQDYYD